MKSLFVTLVFATAALFAPAPVEAKDRRDSFKHKMEKYVRYKMYERMIRDSDRCRDHYRYDYRYRDVHHPGAGPRYNSCGHRIDSHGHRVDRYGRHIGW